MRDIELYRAILGPHSAVDVVAVNLDVAGQHVVVQVDARPGPFVRPERDAPAPPCDGRPRRWRHLDTCQFTTWI